MHTNLCAKIEETFQALWRTKAIPEVLLLQERYADMDQAKAARM